MSNSITLAEPQVNALMATWTGLRLERGVSSTNLASFTLVTQIPYVTGQTSYTYVDTPGAATDWYRVARYVGGTIGTYSPPWPVAMPSTSTGDGARRSLKNCRRMLARKMGSVQVVTTTADGDSAGGSIVSTQLANQLDPNKYRAAWVMPTDGVSAGLVRAIGENALNPQSGTLTVAPPFLSTIVKGTQVELHRLMPPDESMGLPIGLRQALNLALADVWAPDRLALSATGAVTMDLAQIGDWLDADAVRELYGPQLSGWLPIPWGPYATRDDGESVKLDVIGLAPNASVAVEVTRPGDTYIRIGGVWTDQQSGFTNDTDECLFQPHFLTEVALRFCYESLANAATGPAMTRWMKLAEDQLRKVNVMKTSLSHPSERDHTGYPFGYGDDWTSKDWWG